MPDSTVPPTASGEATKQQTPPAGEQSAEVTELKSQVADLSKKLNFFIAEKRAKENAQTPPADDTQQEGSNKEEIRKLKDQIRLRDERAAKALKQKAISDTIAEKGITGEAAKDLRARLLMDHDSAIKVSGEQVVVEDDGLEVDLPAFLDSKFLSGAKGDRYRTSPAAGGARSKPGEKPVISSLDFDSLTPDQVVDMDRKDPEFRRKRMAEAARRMGSGQSI